MMKCVYNENLISRGHTNHICQFGETQDGERVPIFPDEKAILHISDDEHYRVTTSTNECLFVGTGYDEAIGRIKYAQPNIELLIYYEGGEYTKEEFEKEREETGPDEAEM